VRVLVACEFSGIVRDKFRAQGHDAYSCDLLPTERESPYHFQCDVRDILDGAWDLMIAHPPCTRLTVAGARWFKGREHEQQEAIAFAECLWSAPIPRIAIENPVGVLSTRSVLGRSTQIIQPWMFGCGETKATCLWLRGLPSLVPSDVVEGRVARVHREPPSPDRWKNRSRTYPGIAQAMVDQWGTV
jgi:site-specific DNA-cytosine methylase